MSHCTNIITLPCQTLISAVCQYKNGMCSYSVIREDKIQDESCDDMEEDILGYMMQSFIRYWRKKTEQDA